MHEYLIRRTNEKNDWNEHLDQSRILHCGDNLIVEHHPDRAKSRAQYFKLLEMRLQECPTDASAHYYYAMELAAVRNDMQAIEHYIKAAEFSNDPLIKCGARANAGILYGKQHDERYKECFAKAIEYEDIYLEPYY